MTVTAVIPARFASSRFPGKPLALISGKPMIQHVVERCHEAKCFERVVVATHLPPWSSAAWHDGRLSNQDWCTYFVSVAVGRVIEGAARARPDVKFAVLCGHTHGVGVVDLLPNLRCTTGAAEYGSPRVAATFDFGEPDARGLFA